MKKIISREPVTIPDGRGGILETIYVDVPAMQNEETGEVFFFVRLPSGGTDRKNDICFWT